MLIANSKIKNTNVSSEPKLIGVYDINVKNIIDTNLRAKFRRNQQFLEEILEQERQDQIKSQDERKSRRSSALNIDKYKFLKPHDLDSMEFDLKETVLRDPEQIEYR